MAGPGAGLAWKRLHRHLQHVDPPCRGQDPELWFPEPLPDGPWTNEHRLVDARNRTRTGYATRLCAQCPARIECFEFAMSDATVTGIWGGTTDAQRGAHRSRKPA